MPIRNNDHRDEEQRYRDAYQYLEVLFLHFPDHASFQLYDVIAQAVPEGPQRRAMWGCQDELEAIMEEFRYIKAGDFENEIRLTATGRRAKKAGGHIGFQKILEAEKGKEQQLRAGQSSVINVGGNFTGNLMNQSSVSGNDLNQSINTTPSKKNSAYNKTSWYERPLANSVLWPVLVDLLLLVIVILLKMKCNIDT